MSNPFANYRKADPAPETDDQPKPETQKVTTGFPFHDPPRRPEEGFTDDDTGRVNWTMTDDMKAAYSGPGTPHHGREDFPYGLLPPTWPEWMTYLAAESRVDSLADEMLEHGARITEEIRGGLVETFDWTTPLATSYLEAVDAAHAALEEARKMATTLKKYTDPETGVGYLHLVKAKTGKRTVDKVVDAVAGWEATQAITSRPLPALDDTSRPWTIDGLLPQGGLALVVGAADSGKSTLMADLARAAATGEDFLDHAPAKATGVAVIDTGTAPTVLLERYAAALAAGARVVPFRGRAGDLDVRQPSVRAWLAAAIPAGSLVIVDSLAVPMAVLDVSETSADAGGYLAAWATLAAEAKAAGIVVVHASPANDSSRPRGHGSLAALTDVLWIVKHARGKRTLETDTGVALGIDGADAAPDPAKPEEEGGADAASSVSKTNRDRVRDAVLQSLGATTTGVAASAGLTIPGAMPHLNALEEAGEIRREKGKGRSIHWHPA